MHRFKPKGITIFSIIQIVLGALSMISGIIFLVANASTSLQNLLASQGVIDISYSLYGVAYIITGALALTSGIGVILLKNWARILLVVIAVVGLVGGVAGLIGGAINVTTIGYVVYYGLILWYFNKKDTKAVFR